LVLLAAAKAHNLKSSSQNYGLKHLSTGDLLRSEIAGKTELGLKAKSFMDAGQLVPDAVVIGMVDAAISANKGVNGFLFDGFPRTKAQAEALDDLLRSHATEIHVVLALDVPEEEIDPAYDRPGKNFWKNGRCRSGSAEKKNLCLPQRNVGSGRPL